MGSQTLEILRQGVWASLTGGWFYDPHQDVFCNTFHLYLWLFLLCLPFTIYVYFPPTRYIWYVYCVSVTIALATIKLVNYGLHRMYDTSECIQEEVEDEWTHHKREDEGIELQDLSNKSAAEVSQQACNSMASFTDVNIRADVSTDVDSVDSIDYHKMEMGKVKNKKGIIDLKAEVHRKNSSASSDELMEVGAEAFPFCGNMVMFTDEIMDSSHSPSHCSSAKYPKIIIDANGKELARQNSRDIPKRLLKHHRPSLHNIDNEQEPSHIVFRRNNFRNSSLSFIANLQSDIKPTGSLELSYIDKNPNQILTSESFYFKPGSSRNNRVRRIRSTALEICCPPPNLALHPNSVEIIGAHIKGAKNPLPPPSSTLIRNQHLNLCPYYRSEIVFPIAEQSDEHQTSHGPDTDLDSITLNSDSDYEENNQESRSPLLVRIQREHECDLMRICCQMGNCPNGKKKLSISKVLANSEENDRASNTSKDALLDNDNSNSSATPEMQDARGDFPEVDFSEKKHIDCANFGSNSSLEGNEACGGPRTAKYSKSKPGTSKENKEDDIETVEHDAEVEFRPRLVRKRITRRNRRRKSEQKLQEAANFSSLVELDLDWLFDDENDHLKYCKDSNKRNLEWSSTTTVSLEQDVSKVLQETVPAAKSLGAIPKKMKPLATAHYGDFSENPSSHERRKKRSESVDEECSSRSIAKESKLTQTNCHNESSVEGLECLVLPSQHRMRKGCIARRNVKVPRNRLDPYQDSLNNTLELATPSKPLLNRPEVLWQRRGNRKGKRTQCRHRPQLPARCCPDNEFIDALMSGAPNPLSYTCEGPIYYYMDDNGKIITYSLGEKGLVIANTGGHIPDHLAPSTSAPKPIESYESSTEDPCSISIPELINSLKINTNSMIPTQAPHRPTIPPNTTRRRHIEPLENTNLTENCMFDSLHIYTEENINKDLELPIQQRNRFRFIQEVDTLNNNYPRTKTYYKFKLTPWNYLKVTLDRLKLLTLLDRNLTLTETIFSIILGVFVGIFGSILLYLEFYQDLSAFIFCFIIASCQYSLLKSVQPDSASPTHGFNRIIAYSRPVYFCLFSLVILCLHLIIPWGKSVEFTLFKVVFYAEYVVLLRDFFVKFILFFPFLFSMGLFPQINTFLLYFMEQIDIHIFGGNAMCSLSSAFYCIFRSFLAVLVLYGLAYGGLTEPKSSQHVLFSLFCASLISSCYHLSRSASDFTHIWNILKANLWPPDIYREHKKAPKSIVFKNSSQIDKEYKNKNYKDNKSSKEYTVSYKNTGSVENTTLNNSSVFKNTTEGSENTSTFFENTQETTTRNDGKNNEKRDRKVNLSEEHVNKFKTSEKPTKKSGISTNNNNKDKSSEEMVDPLPYKLQKTINGRLRSDVILCSFIALAVFGLHMSTVFTALQPDLSPVLWSISAGLGFLLHYLVPQMRKQLPWLCIARPLLRSHEHDYYQVREAAHIMWFERVYVYLCTLERNILYPLLVLSALTEDSPKIVEKFGPLAGTLLVVVCGIKCTRSAYSNQNIQYLIVTFTVLFFTYDYKDASEGFLMNYFIMGIIFHKVYELLLKVQFVVTYIAPWQITWGSAFHAFAQPFAVPHSAMLFSQAIISALLSTPLSPFLGSAIFLTSYVRPIKFWERDYNTRRVDHSNTPLSSHLDRNLGADDNNLNSIFYEHLTRSLQHSLCGDLMMGRWGPVSQGDCFVLASDYLNCLVHVIELGNGLVTFQMRGLEFRGTYCQQREVEAITEGVEENDGCCCCDPGHLPNMLSVNAAFSQRWLAWEVTAAKYVLEGYSISDNSAVSMLQVYDFRKVLVTYYVKSIIFYAIKSPKLEEWLTSRTLEKALEPMNDRNFVDLDCVFNSNVDEDYDNSSSGMTKAMFFTIYGPWVFYCAEKFEKNIDTSLHSKLTLLCFALSLVGRRTLSNASYCVAPNVEYFLYGLHALFKGDFRIQCSRDEWIFSDVDLLKSVAGPAVRMSLKLHQDHFMSPDEYEEMPALFDAILKYEEELVLCHEGDPAWRNAVLSGKPSLLSLRHVLDDGSDEYKIIMLNKRHLSFRVIQVNKECVRGLWAGQQQELVYLRNRNPERGSIQNAKQALRNIINSSCDQPIGYPIYVSPLTTSYAETNEQLCSLVGGSISLTKIRNQFLDLFRRIRKRCGEGCSSGGSTRDDLGLGHEGVYAMTPMAALGHHTAGSQSTEGSHLGGSIGRGSSLSRTSVGGNRGSFASMGKPTSSTLASLAGLFKERDERAVSQMPDGQNRNDERCGEVDQEKDLINQRFKITDPNLVYDCINLGRRIDVLWPNEQMRAKGGRSYWRDWLPESGMEGHVVHRWIPSHKDPSKRSHVDRTILLLQIDDKFVPIADGGVQEVNGGET